MAKKSKKTDRPEDSKTNPEAESDFDFDTKIPSLQDLMDLIPEGPESSEADVVKKIAKAISIYNPIITTDDWAATHPEGITCGSDKYYVLLARELNHEFTFILTEGKLPPGFSVAVAMSLAAYLEDTVNSTGVWQTVRNLYKKKYGQQLPFYDVDPDDYYDDDINIEDIRLIIWQALCRCGAEVGMIYSPLSQLVTKMSKTTFDILVENFEKAPRAPRIANLVKKTFRSGDIYELRLLGLWLTSRNPLTAAPFALDDIRDEAEDELEDYARLNSSLGYDEVKYFTECGRSWLRYMSMLGCSTQTFLAELASVYGFDDLAEKIRDIIVLPPTYYKITDSKGRYITATNWLGEEFKIVKNSYGQAIDWSTIKYTLAPMMRFDGEYHPNGMSSSSMSEIKKPDNVPLNSFPSERKKQIEKLVESHNGRRIFYCRDFDEVSAIVGCGLIPEEDTSRFVQADNFLLMLSNVNGPVIIPGCCAIFEDKDNPFFGALSEEKLADEQLTFIGYANLSDDLIDYIVSHRLLTKAAIMASQGKEVGHRLVQDNLEFIMRFSRVESYPYPDEDDDEDDEHKEEDEDEFLHLLDEDEGDDDNDNDF